MGAEVPEWIIMSILLNILGPTYKIWTQQIIQQIRQNPNIKLDDILLQLLDEDRRKQAKEDNITLYSNKTSNITLKRQPKKCTYYYKKGHLEKDY